MGQAIADLADQLEAASDAIKPAGFVRTSAEPSAFEATDEPADVVEDEPAKPAKKAAAKKAAAKP